MPLHRLPRLRTPYVLASAQFDSWQLATLLKKAPEVPPGGPNETAKAAHFARRLVRRAVAIRSAAAERNVSVALVLPACFGHATFASSTLGFRGRRSGATAHGPVAGGETTEGALAKLMLRSRVGHTSSGGGATRLSFVDECEGFACAAEALC